ncbi:YjfB family protein [Alicyclobacillus mengziensis]|uniref:YjfB family protein n=1 Tax=Alicyclobacillus mengziensis TaxID=2931921 RepID=A0A9X7Z6J0_9BACL|nr:YjfB family protein [Alicyclobacillus mengziensis]
MINAASISAFAQHQTQTQYGIDVLKKTMDAQTSAATALINGFNKVESAITASISTPGKGQNFDSYA